MFVCRACVGVLWSIMYMRVLQTKMLVIQLTTFLHHIFVNKAAL